jgi:hypothetical protein
VVQAAGRVGADAEDVDPAGRDLHDEQDVEPAQSNGVEMEEVGGEQPGRLSPQERAPRRVSFARCWAESAVGEGTADGAGTDAVAEADEFALGCVDVPRSGSPAPDAGSGRGCRR